MAIVSIGRARVCCMMLAIMKLFSRRIRACVDGEDDCRVFCIHESTRREEAMMSCPTRVDRRKDEIAWSIEDADISGTRINQI